jgi:hypothetical protein
MNLLNFTTLFPDEASCKAKWKEYRDKQGGNMSPLRKHGTLLEKRQGKLRV